MDCEEALPSTICITCSNSVLEASAFRTLVQRSQHQWNSMVLLLQHVPKHEYNQFSDNILAIVSNDFINITDTCTKPFVEKPKEPTVKRFGKIMICQCPMCDKSFQYASLLHKHLKESADMVRACHICAAVMSREKLVKHLKHSHKIKPYDCEKCPALFLNAKPYLEHSLTAHAPGAITCGDCSRSFKNLPAFRAHQSVHSRRSCPNCDKKFQNQMCYTHHVKKCCKLDTKKENLPKIVTLRNKENKEVKMGNRGSTNNKCICDYCNKIFSAKKYVAAHIEIVHTKTTHRPCTYCGKIFAAAHMSTHVQTHTNHKYECEQCGAILKSKLGFYQHMRLHTGERPYRCEHCGQTFAASSRRSYHIQTKHFKSQIVLRHECTLCPAKFKLPSKLRLHIRNVHKAKDETVHECEECLEKFASYRSLQNHSKKHIN